MTDIFSTDREYVANTYARFPIDIVSGKGSLVYDCDGKEYIDLGSGIAVNTFGVADEEWIKAVTAQLGKFQHTSNLYYTEPCAKLAKELCKKTGMKKVFFSNSGAEANECAIKAARKYAADKKGKGCFKIITLNNSFHGRTLTTLAATGQDAFHHDFLPLTEGFVSVEPTEEALRAEIGDDTAAIMFEIVRGEGGVIPLEKEFVRAMVNIAKEKDILLIADEVQCGNGRSGKLYAYELRSHSRHRVHGKRALRWVAARRDNARRKSRERFHSRFAWFDIRRKPRLLRGGAECAFKD